MDINYKLYTETKNNIYEVKKQIALSESDTEIDRLEKQFIKLKNELNALRKVLNII